MFTAKANNSIQRIGRLRPPPDDFFVVNVDFPVWMIQLPDEEARRSGVPRESIIKVWVAEHLEKAS
ncbi:MAG: hypothetical protein FD159_1650 [Syntrophaceae bacterium]|nr:MAG: hypothetical protein FD159_1650 [Syntrophaceae bacterium]